MAFGATDLQGPDCEAATNNLEGDEWSQNDTGFLSSFEEWADPCWSRFPDGRTLGLELYFKWFTANMSLIALKVQYGTVWSPASTRER
jgi:hypothetical protein